MSNQNKEIHTPLLDMAADQSADDGVSDYETEDDVELDGETRLTMEEELQLQQDDEEEEEEEVRETGIYTFLKRASVVYPAETAQILLSLLWSGSFVYLTDNGFVYPSILRGLMYGWSAYFFLFWIWKVIIKENRLKYMVSLFAIIDYLTLIPFFVNHPRLNVLMSLRVLYLWRVFRVFPVTISPIVRSILKLGASILMLIYISAAFLMAVEPGVMHNYVTACYFATVTIATVGYGDIQMTGNPGRILVIIIILTAFVFIPWQGYFLSKIIALTPAPWQRSLDMDVRKYRHVVLTGKITKQRISMFLREFLTPNNHDYRVVILDSEDQGAAFEKYIKDSGYWKRVRYYVGSPIIDADLQRVHVAEASAAFVWSDTTSKCPEQADRMAILTCLGIKSHSYWIKTYVEVILPESKARIGEVGPNMFVMSHQEMKNTALSRACEVDGLLSFCSVLLTTFGNPSTALDSAFAQGETSPIKLNPALGVLPGHSSDRGALEPSAALLADLVLRRGESHESRVRASLSGGASFKLQANPHHIHGSHRSFHYKDTKENAQSFLKFAGDLRRGASMGAIPQIQRIPATPLENVVVTANDRPTLENAYKEYLWTRTCTVEIVVVPATFADRTFSEAASSLYTTYGVVLLGLRAMGGSLELNPGPNYVVRGGEAAYIIGRNRDVRLLKQTFERMATSDGTAVNGRTLDFALDPRLEQSPFAPRSLRKSAADELFTQTVQAAAAAAMQNQDPLTRYKNTHHLTTEQRTYEEALKVPPSSSSVGANVPTSSNSSTPIMPRFHTFNSPSLSQSFGPAHPQQRSQRVKKNKNLSGMHDHIIFCSSAPDIDWNSLIEPLRSKLVSPQRPIVIVTTVPISAEQWYYMSFFPDVWVVEGNPLVASDLMRAHIDTSSTIVILSCPHMAEDESVIDEKAIVTYNSVKAHFGHKRIFLDLAKPANSRLVAPEVGRVGIYENPEFIAGHLYDASLHDTIMAKAFDTPFLMELIQILIGCNNDGVSLVSVPVPDIARGSHFETLFSLFPDCIPIGLLRRNPVPALRKFPYICICPPQSAVVGAKDQIFLLAPATFLLRQAAKENKHKKNRL